MKKKIAHDFGARRGRASGRIVGRDKDCIIIPMRSWDGDLIGVECINWEGDKQTFGSKGQLILGHPEGAEYVHVAEGWATMWAISQLRPRSFAGVVAFGKKLRQKAEEITNRFPGTAVTHPEGADNQDVWDYWSAGHGDQYFGGKCL
jgi:putative DNA primase/helicase